MIYDGSVTGLRQGSSVRFPGRRRRGAASGAFEEDPTKVRITIEIDCMTPVRADTIATLGSRPHGALCPVDGRISRRPPSRRSPASDCASHRALQLDEAPKGAPEIVAGANELLARVNTC